MKKIITLSLMVIFALCLHASTTTTNPIDITTNNDGTNTRALGLQFTLIDNDTAYEVSRGTATATEIEIPDIYNFLPVRRIANNGFIGLTSLINITIPVSITSIGYCAFYNCSNLINITIPTGVTSIGGEAFYGCSSLISITIPAGVTSIYGRHFAYCSSLTSIAVSENNQVYRSEGNCLIQISNNFLVVGCLTSVIPNNVTIIGESAFTGRNNLTNITIPEGVTDIGSQAFQDCSNLSSITIPDGVIYTGSDIFKGCSSLISISIPESMLGIGAGAFYGCSSLTSIIISENTEWIGSSAFYGCSNLTNITIPEGVTHIGAEAFYACFSLMTITIPMSVTNIGQYTFYGCGTLVIFTELENQPIGWESNWNGGRPVVWGGGSGSLSYTLINNGTSYEVSRGSATEAIIIIPSIYNNLPVTSISERGFIEFTSLNNIIIPEGIINVGSQAFQYCSSLTNISIPASVITIGGSAFRECSNLTSISISSGVTSIGSNAFSGCSNLSSINVDINNQVFRSEGNCLVQGSTVILGCSTSIIPENIISIGYGAFSNCLNLINLTITEGVTNIEGGAFAGCSGLTSINFPSSVITIDSSAFIGCSNLSNISVATGNQVYRSEGNCLIRGSTLVLGCLSSEIPNNVTIIGESAFRQSNIVTIEIPGNILSIWQYAFYDCTRLTNVTITEGITSIGDLAFFDCYNLTSITIPESMISIGVSAFFGCSSLTNITIPESVTSIGGSAFYGCSSLTNITIPESMISIGGSAFSGCSSLTNITIPESVASIGQNAFNGCSSLISIIIPVGVASIGQNAFNGCSGLVIFTGLANKPAGWHTNWNPSNRPVIWGVTTAPVPPTTLTSQHTNNTVHLSWSQPTNVYIPNFISYAIYCDDVLLADTGITNPSYTDVVTELGEHTYIVKAVYTTGISDPSNEITVNIENIEYNHLPPTNLQSTITEAQSVALSWEAPTASGLLNYNIYRKAGSAEGFTLLDQTTELEYDDDQVVAGILYEYYVTAVYPTGESVPADIVQAIFYSLLPPSNLLAIITESISITLNWEAPSVLGVENYKLYRREIATDEFAILNQTATGEVLTYTDTDVVAGTTYQYCITAVYPAGESAQSNIIFVVFYYMLPPENLVVANPDSPSVILNWEAPEAVGLSGYKIYRKTGADGEFIGIHQTAELSFEDTQVEENVTYQYYVTGVYPSGESGISNIVTATVRPLSDNDIVGVAVTRLAGNYPNPFNPTTTISFEMASEGNVVIEVYSVKGQLVRKLVNGVRGAGVHKIVWDGRDDAGRGVSSGVYFYRMVTGDYKNVKKMVMVK